MSTSGEQGGQTEITAEQLKDRIERRGRRKVVMRFGKHKGLTVREMVRIDPAYSIWLLTMPNLGNYLRETIEMFLAEKRSPRSGP